MIKNVKIMKMKFIYVVLVALLLGSQMTLSAQNRDNKEKKKLKEHRLPIKRMLRDR